PRSASRAGSSRVSAMRRARAMCWPSEGTLDLYPVRGHAGEQACDERGTQLAARPRWGTLRANDAVGGDHDHVQHAERVGAQGGAGLGALDQDLGVSWHEPLRGPRNRNYTITAEVSIARVVVGEGDVLG